MATGDVLCRSGWLPGVAGALHCLHLQPASAPSNGDGNRRAIVFCAPFGEEVNRSRRTVHLAARGLAAAGHEVLLVDPFGAGDSAGEFADATWNIWTRDTIEAARWLCSSSGLDRLVLWGLRTGAATALEVAAAVPCERLLLWQPVVSGSAFVTQFLRQNAASRAAAPAGEGEPRAGELRAILRAGQVIEVEGYAFTNQMCEALEAIDLIQSPPPVPVHWAEVVPDPGRPFAAASRRLIEIWEGAGVWIDDTKVVGAGFWSTPEPSISAGLVAQAASLGAAWRDVRGPMHRVAPLPRQGR